MTHRFLDWNRPDTKALGWHLKRIAKATKAMDRSLCGCGIASCSFREAWTLRAACLRLQQALRPVSA
jgi:hypothetical protein